MRKLLCLVAVLLTAFAAAPGYAQQQEKRIALVIGNSAYPSGALANAANDAGLVAQTLQAAGFDVTGARDLDAATLRSSFREFVDKASGSGPETVALVYFAGYGLQFEGENYLAPIDARLARDSDVPLEAIRVNDLLKPLSSLTLKARIVILDAGRANKFAIAGQPLAGGLALMQPDAGTLIAFNAAPGTVGPDTKGSYGAYATAIAEMIKAGGLPLDELFERVRLRVNDLTHGAELTWQTSRVQVPFVFFERTASAPPAAQDHFAELRSKPIRDFDANDAYLAALARDTLRAYEDFLVSYPNDPLAKRVRAIVAARREAITWRESALADTPDSYWSYLHRYPRGPHAYDARRRLAHFAAALEPPSAFAAITYDVPPPPPDEIIFVERPYLYFADPIYALPPPPPVPVMFLAPRPIYFVELPPPPPPIELFVLPFPIYHPVPLWVERPVYVVQPVNLISVNIHNTVVINQVNNTVVVTNPAGQQVPALPPAALHGAGPGQGSPAGLLQAHPGSAAAVIALPAAAALRTKQVQPTTTPAQSLQPPRPGAPQPLPSSSIHAQPSSTPGSMGKPQPLPTVTSPQTPRAAGKPLATPPPAPATSAGQQGGTTGTQNHALTAPAAPLRKANPTQPRPLPAQTSPSAASRTLSAPGIQSTPSAALRREKAVQQRQQAAEQRQQFQQQRAQQMQALQLRKQQVQVQRQQRLAAAQRQSKAQPKPKGRL